jgi:hypothetical protein
MERRSPQEILPLEIFNSYRRECSPRFHIVLIGKFNKSSFFSHMTLLCPMFNSLLLDSPVSSISYLMLYFAITDSPFQDQEIALGRSCCLGRGIPSSKKPGAKVALVAYQDRLTVRSGCLRVPGSLLRHFKTRK